MPKKTAKDGTVTIAFDDGVSESFSLSELSDDMKQTLALHGLSQKLGDCYAGPEKKPIAFDLVMGVWENLTEGNWTLRGESAPRTTILVRALLAIDPTLDEKELTKKVSELDKKAKTAIERDPVVAEKVARIKSEDAIARLEKAKEAAAGETIDIMELLS